MSEIRLENNVFLMIDNSNHKDIKDRPKKLSGVRYLAAFIVLILVAVFVAQIFFPKLADILPQKDPYKLEELDKRQQELYATMAQQELTPSMEHELAMLAFLKGEVHEAEYFLEKAEASGFDVVSLKLKIAQYKSFKTQLENGLYENRKFFNTPFVYEDDYEIIDRILSLSDIGYVKVRHLFLKGYLLLREGRRTEARRIFNDLKNHGGVLAPTSQYLYARTYIDDSEIKHGVAAFAEYIDANPETRLTPLAYYFKSTLYHAKEDYSKAVEIAKEGIELQADTEYIPDLYLAMELSLRQIDDEKADDTLKKVFESHPNNSFVFQRALEVYDEIIEGEIPIEKNLLYLEMCNVLIENGRHTQSKELLDKLNLEGNKWEKAYSLYLDGKRLRGMRNYDTAIARCRSALQNLDDINLRSRIYLLMGEIFGLQRNVASAERYYKLSGDSQGEVGDFALRSIGRIAYRNGWRIKAENYYSDLVEKFPDSPYVSEALNYLVVLAFYKNDRRACERYALMLSEKGTNYEDRLKGKYFLYRLGKGSKSYAADYPLCYYSFIVEDNPVKLHLEPHETYPSVNRHKDNLAWEYFLASCYDLADKEFKYQNDPDNPYSKMAFSYLGFFERQPHIGIIRSRDFTAGNFQAEIEHGYVSWFMEKSFPILYYNEIEKYAPEKDFTLAFVLGIIRQESFFNTDAVSSAGALGLMQIMPATGRWIAERLGERRSFNNSILREPDTNIRYGVWYLEHLRDLMGNEAGMILAGHNGGPGNLSRWKEMYPVWQSDIYLFYELIPIMETRNFVRNVLVNQYIYGKLIDEEGVKVYF